MRTRLISVALVLVMGYLLRLTMSGARLRVHVEAALTWAPLLFFLSVLVLTDSLSRRKKIALVGAVLVLGGGIMAYTGTLVVMKATFDSWSWICSSLLLAVGLTVVLYLSRILERGLRHIANDGPN